MKLVLNSYGRAFLMQFNLKMFLLSLIPSFLALVLWAVILYFSLQPVLDFLQQFFIDHEGLQKAGDLLNFLGLMAFKTVIVPLVAMWLLLPLMLMSALLFVGSIAMPVINRTVSQRNYPNLEKRQGGSWWGSIGLALICFFGFVFAWLVTLPLSLFLHLGLFIQPILLGWLTYRTMAYEALADHATAEERETVLQQHRWQLWFVGVATGLMGVLPGLVWLGGVLSFVFLPILAAVSIWLYVIVFMFSGFWFQHFCLDALQNLRQENSNQKGAA